MSPPAQVRNEVNQSFGTPESHDEPYGGEAMWGGPLCIPLPGSSKIPTVEGGLLADVALRRALMANIGCRSNVCGLDATRCRFKCSSSHHFIFVHRQQPVHPFPSLPIVKIRVLRSKVAAAAIQLCFSIFGTVQAAESGVSD